MWTFIILVVLAIVFGQKLSSLRQHNEQLSRRIADLNLEISAVRKAFLTRIEKLEQGRAAAPAPEEAPTAVQVVEPAPLSVSETPPEEARPEPPPPPRYVPPPAPVEAEAPVYARLPQPGPASSGSG